MAVQKVEIEIWDKAKQRIADITNLARNRNTVLKLNGIDTLQFSMDLHEYEAYCAKIGIHPRTLLWPLTVDIIVKLDGTYWKGFECVAATPYLNKSGATLSVRALGFLSLFSRRHTSETFVGVESTEVAADIIMATQAQANGDFGVTIGSQQYVTGVPRDRDYLRKNIKDELVSLTRLETGQFDMNFTYDKKFETYEQLGALRTDTPLLYGPGGNIEVTDAPTEGGSVANNITGLGSGFGADQVTSTQSDATSQLTYGVREDLPQWNSVINEDELAENAAGYLAQVKDMLQIPNVTTTSKYLDLLTTSAGDRFPVDLSRHAFTDNINGLYRAEEITVDWDDNDFATITFKFDDQGVDQDEA